MNLPNALTLSRLALTALFVIALSIEFPWHQSVALFFFLVASLTDYLDGEIARGRNLVTDFGKLMDPLADKILTASAFVCLIPGGMVAAWVVIIIISREFLITGLRLLASTKSVILPAEKLGKHKTAWQLITIIYFLGWQAAREWVGVPSAGAQATALSIGEGLIVITVVMTVYSGLAYFWKNRALLDPS